MQLWIDDIRPCPDGRLWAKTSAEAIATLAYKVIAKVSFDHDLGGDDTSRRVVLWLCEHEDRWPTTVRVHSANPVGVEWLTGMVDRYGPGVAH